MGIRSAWVVALILNGLLLSFDAYAQDETIRINTDLVAVPVTVLDRNGRHVSDLAKEDFQVYEDGVEQAIEFFEPVENTVTVFLLLDVSGSVTMHAADIARAADTFIKQLRPDDRIIAATFAYNVNVLLQATKVKDLRKKIEIRQYSLDRDTLIYDAAEFALKKMEKIRGRRAIILFSDGKGSGLSASARSNLRDAEEGEALIYTIQFGASDPPSPFVEEKKARKWAETANWYMREMAERTGGRHYQIESITDLASTFGTIAGELSRQYSLGYYPKKEGKKGERRQIRVTVRQPGLAVRSRGSYIVQPSNR